MYIYDDRPGGSLLISTDKHIVSLPLDQHTTPKGGEEEGRKQKVHTCRYGTVEFVSFLTLCLFHSQRFLLPYHFCIYEYYYTYTNIYITYICFNGYTYKYIIAYI
jgi:hypothetical protein